MSRPALVRALLASLGTALGLAGLAWLSAVLVPFHASEEARVRLSWTARPERIERCRTLSAEELAERLEHMRQRVECTGEFATYALRVEVDGVAVRELVVRGGGFRHDRPLHLLENLPVAAGRHQVRVTFRRREAAAGGTGGDSLALTAPGAAERDTGLYAGRAARELAERVRRLRAAIPASLALDTVLAFSPREVVLVTFNAEHRMLELNRRPGGR